MVLIAVIGAYYIAVRLGWADVPSFLIKDEEGKVLGEAVQAYRNEDYRLAAEKYREYLVRVPGDVDCWYGLAVSLGQDGKTEQAFAAAKKAELLKPDDRKIEGVIALLHIARGEYAQAIKIYDRLLEEHPHDQASLGNRAFAYHRLGREEEAMRAYLLGVKEFPASPELRYALGVLYHDRGEYEKALEQLRQASHLNLRYEEAYLMMARCSKALGDNEDAGYWAKKCLLLVSAGKEEVARDARELLVDITREERLSREGN